MAGKILSRKTIGLVSVVVGSVLIALWICVTEVLNTRQQREEFCNLSSRNRPMHCAGSMFFCDNGVDRN